MPASLGLALNAERAVRADSRSAASSARILVVSRRCSSSFAGGHSSSDGDGVALVKCE